MKEMPQIILLDDGSKIWENKFEKFQVKVYIPKCDLPTDIINYGFITPICLYLKKINIHLKKQRIR